ncbi:polycomb protein e(z) [Cryptococcus gattii Ru294]|nr:polycomb protein e(z) [Cryptococcus gattii Ru294]
MPPRQPGGLKPPPKVPPEIHNTVRQTWVQTWKDFYSWKPPSTLPVEDGWMSMRAEEDDKNLVKGHEDFSKRMAALMEKFEQESGGELKSVEIEFQGATELRPLQNPNKPPIEWNLHGRSIRPLPPIYKLTPTIEPVPEYSFCIYTPRSILSPDEVIMPFMPTFDDDTLDIPEFEAEKEKYSSLFTNCLWDLPGRDADVDIIMFETLKRLEKLGIEKEDIDKTRILPKDCFYVESLDLRRDMPPFPLAPQNINPVEGVKLPDSSKRVVGAKRKWEEPLELIEEDFEADLEGFEEACCHYPTCTSVMCIRHAGMYFDGLTRNGSKGSSFNAGNQRLPRISSVLHTLSEPCSPTCYSLTSNEATLGARLSSMRLEKRGWSESDKQQLIDILSAYEGSGLERICGLKAVFNRTCAEIAQQITTILQDRSRGPSVHEAGVEIEYSTSSSTSGSSRPLLQRSKSSKAQLIPITNRLPEFTECEHGGECVPGVCSCADNKLPCGRHCSCPSTCIRRHRGCNCRRILIQEGKPVREGKVCINGKCPCIRSFRECDKELCGSCGAAEELVQDEAILKARGKFGKDGEWIENEDKTTQGQTFISCGNIALQKAKWPKLRVGISKVAGYGLFADEDIGHHVPVGEYVGEYISEWEGDNRNFAESINKRRYQFTINPQFITDAGFFGNHTRFINSAQGNNVNCVAHQRAVGHELRILFLTTRPIKRHEEIHFNYGDDFWDNH